MEARLRTKPGDQISIDEYRRALAHRIARYAPADGESHTPITNLFITSRTSAGDCRADLEPCLVVFAQGKKIFRLGNKEYTAKQNSFVLTSVELPLGGQIIQATPDKPCLLLRIVLDMSMVREVLAENTFSSAAERARGPGIVFGESSLELLDACYRLLGLLESPAEIPFLGRLIQREILYRLLRSSHGARLRSIATAGELGNRLSNAVAWLKAHYAESIQMADLASIAGMGVSTLNHQFRTLTGMSPLQYQKQLRLYTARDRMMLQGLDASSAAFGVGYESVSQFNREYRRLFGQPPMRSVRDGRRRT